VHYCDAIQAAVDYATARGKRVAVIAQPRLQNQAASRHAEQQRALADLAARVFSHNPRVQYVDMSNATDLSNPELSFDGMHLTPAGNRLIAQALVKPLTDMTVERSAR
jgi:lysophospholipase L1-like esterase